MTNDIFLILSISIFFNLLMKSRNKILLTTFTFLIKFNNQIRRIISQLLSPLKLLKMHHYNTKTNLGRIFKLTFPLFKHRQLFSKLWTPLWETNRKCPNTYKICKTVLTIEKPPHSLHEYKNSTNTRNFIPQAQFARYSNFR